VVCRAQAGEQLLQDYVFIHLDQPADKLALLLQARMPLQFLSSSSDGQCCFDSIHRTVCLYLWQRPAAGGSRKKSTCTYTAEASHLVKVLRQMLGKLCALFSRV